ncbi:MAG TPA: hypothetical protein PLA50_11630 [Bacteroidia bacterium]|nr:hypothetical protein [Bacteroidia bacterium]
MEKHIASAVSLMACAVIATAWGEEPKQREAGWLPPEDTLVLPVQESASPDGRYAIGWGYERGPVDWSRLAFREAEGSEWGAVTFSTALAPDSLGEALENDANFLLDLRTGKPLCKLGFHYPGERPRFNHHGLVVVWSPQSTCFVAIVERKWESEFVHYARIENGACAGSFDVKEALSAAACQAVSSSRHPAANRLKSEDDFMYSLVEISLEDDGAFIAMVTGEVPKLEGPKSWFEVRIEGRFSVEKGSGAAGVDLVSAMVTPASEE